MVQLINKGGFRERANRSRRYAGSENRQTTLAPNSYTKKEEQAIETATTRPLVNVQDQTQSSDQTG